MNSLIRTITIVGALFVYPIPALAQNINQQISATLTSPNLEKLEEERQILRQQFETLMLEEIVAREWFTHFPNTVFNENSSHIEALEIKMTNKGIYVNYITRILGNRKLQIIFTMPSEYQSDLKINGTSNLIYNTSREKSELKENVMYPLINKDKIPMTISESLHNTITDLRDVNIELDKIPKTTRVDSAKTTPIERFKKKRN